MIRKKIKTSSTSLILISVLLFLFFSNAVAQENGKGIGETTKIAIENQVLKQTRELENKINDLIKWKEIALIIIGLLVAALGGIGGVLWRVRKGIPSMIEKYVDINAQTYVEKHAEKYAGDYIKVLAAQEFSKARLIEREEFNLFISDMKNEFKLFEENVRARILLLVGYIQWKEGNIENAIEITEGALKLNAKDEYILEIKNNLAYYYAQLKKNYNKTKALEYCEALLKEFEKYKEIEWINTCSCVKTFFAETQNEIKKTNIFINTWMEYPGVNKEKLEEYSRLLKTKNFK